MHTVYTMVCVVHTVYGDGHSCYYIHTLGYPDLGAVKSHGTIPFVPLSGSERTANSTSTDCARCHARHLCVWHDGSDRPMRRRLPAPTCREQHARRPSQVPAAASQARPGQALPFLSSPFLASSCLLSCLLSCVLPPDSNPACLHCFATSRAI